MARHINFNTSKVRYYEKWFASPWPNLLRHYLLLEFRSQLWIERAKLLLRSKPDLRRQRIEAYRQVLAAACVGDSLRVRPVRGSPHKINGSQAYVGRARHEGKELTACGQSG